MAVLAGLSDELAGQEWLISPGAEAQVKDL